MTTVTFIALAFAGGVLVGGLFCAALWRSVRSLASHSRPMSALLLGSVVRTAFVIAAIVLMTGLQPALTVAALAGFLVARLAASRVVCRTLTPQRAARRPEAT